MLGRTASSLFWMSRYHERAQNIAKLLEVAYRTAMVPHSAQDSASDWRLALASSGCEYGYTQKAGEVSARGVTAYMIFDRENPSSVRTCLEMARNNARSVRTGITTELWDAINTTFIEFSDVNPQSITQDKLPDFLAWISQRAHLFRGALLNTILRDDGYYFSQLGNFVERADNTARILDTQYWVLLPDNDVIGDGSMERHQWSGMLRSLSGLRSYRFAYPNAKLKAFNIAEFLILRKEMPRSLTHCYDWIDETAEDLAQFYGSRSPSIDMATDIYRELGEAQLRDIYQDGLHEFLTDFIGRNNSFAAQLAKDYNFT
ncbi:alpha-E domain-containing protein [Roseibium sp. RKSG952]|uniref:alpha-E domain-containing protein n=1 Tax=Roseibium sp. RKSG952 TaxID=2529384 RepID=UPI0012BB9CEC|nr:alpha-E domain-containing protein [Roseibium sp. RKSG952]MTH97387.1 alpha-E domain-containing protein [Roseibium sp. RKSG952]